MFDRDEFRREIGEPAFSRGLDYFRRDRVRSLDCDAPTRFRGRVSGSRADDYSVSAILSLRDEGRLRRVEGFCSCPVGHNCKHVAALLLAVAERPPQAGMPDRTPPVPPEVRRWLNMWPGRGGEAAAVRPSGPPEPGQDHLFYVIGRSDMGGMSIDPYRAYLKKDGTIGSNFGPFERRSSWAARNLTAQDAGLLGKIAFFCGDGYEPGNGWPEGAELVDLLREIVETGRARMGDIHGMALAWGAPRAVGFLWEVDEAGAQRLAARDAAAVTVLPFPTPFFVNAETGETGVAETAIPLDMASWLASVRRGAARGGRRGGLQDVADRTDRVGASARAGRGTHRRAPEPVLILYGRERNVTDRIVAWVRGQPRSYRLGCIDAVLGLGR